MLFTHTDLLQFLSPYSFLTWTEKTSPFNQQAKHLRTLYDGTQHYLRDTPPKHCDH